LQGYVLGANDRTSSVISARRESRSRRNCQASRKPRRRQCDRHDVERATTWCYRQNDERDAPGSQVLLVANAAVGGEQQLEPSVLGGVQQRPVVERVPAFGLRRVDRMS